MPELTALWAAYRASRSLGDRNAVAAAGHATLVAVVAAVCQKPYREEALQEVYPNYLRAVETYDPAKGSFSTWVQRWCSRKAQGWACQEKGSRAVQAEDDEVQDEPAAPAVEPTAGRMDAIKDLLRWLPAKQRRAVWLVHFRGLTTAKAGRVMGCSDWQVSKLCAKGLAEARRVAFEMGLAFEDF